MVVGEVAGGDGGASERLAVGEVELLAVGGVFVFAAEVAGGVAVLLDRGCCHGRHTSAVAPISKSNPTAAAGISHRLDARPARGVVTTACHLRAWLVAAVVRAASAGVVSAA